MRKPLLLISMICLSAISLAQAAKPKLMVIPSDQWCYSRGYMQEFKDQGSSQEVADYKKALMMDPDINNVISKINILMTDRGFPLENLESVIKSLSASEAEESLVQSKSGSTAIESPLDRLRRQAKADIILQISWNINISGPKKSVTYNLQGIDSYSNKQIAGAQGTGNPSFSADIPVLIEEAVLANMDNFTGQLIKHFSEMAEIGRETSYAIRVFNNDRGVDLETEFDGKELIEIIDDWFAKNSVQGRFSKSDYTGTRADYDQVRIPLYQSNGTTALTAEYFARELRKYLAATPYNIPSKIVPQGLGKCTLYLGEK